LPGSLESFIGSDDDVELGIEESVTGVCVEGSVLEDVLLEEKERDAIGVSFWIEARPETSSAPTSSSEGRLLQLSPDDGNNAQPKNEKLSWKHYGVMES
jgi:hypothetical protein